MEYDGREQKELIRQARLLTVTLPSANAQGSLILFEPSFDKKQSTPYILSLPTAEAKPKQAIEPANGTTLTIGQNDAPILDFGGDKIADVKTVVIEGIPALRTEYDSEKKILSVFLNQALTKSAAKLALQFRDANSKRIATLILEIQAGAKAATDNTTNTTKTPGQN